MKNKKLTYILVPVVIIVWGIIIYRIIGYSDKGDFVVVQNTQDFQTSEYMVQQQKVHLKANYPDPFLSNVALFDKELNGFEDEEEMVNEKEKIAPPEIKVPIKRIDWPKMVFGGVISDKANSKIIGLLKIDNEDALIKKGDIVKDIEILEIYKDSVVVKYKEEQKTQVKI